LEEAEVARHKMRKGGVMVHGAVDGEREKGLSGRGSEESFDHLRASEVTIKGD